MEKGALSMQQQITIDMIESKEFKIKARGYDQEEVDTFLDEICDELERKQNAIAKLQQQLREAQAARSSAPVQPAAPAPAAVKAVGTDDIREMLEMAQRIKNETVAEAQKKADAIIADAQAKAEMQLGDLTSQRNRLASEVEELKKAAADFRAKFAALLDEQKAVLDKAEI